MEESHGLNLPGMTRKGVEPCGTLKPYRLMDEISPLIHRPILILATATITDDNIFSNGLFQNIYLLYKMFDAMGYTSLLLVNSKPKNLDGIPEVLRSCRVIAVEDLVKQPIPVKIYIEIGMSIDNAIRRFLKMVGAKTCKLYLGNILNIDTETPIFYPGMNFSHHVVGEIDNIWVSPHYGQHAEYACALNHVSIDESKPKIAPYVWDPIILTDDGKRKLTWTPPLPGDVQKVIVMEPNISFQKTALIPILGIERWYRKNKSWNGEVYIFNGERLGMTPFFRESILPTLDLHKDGKLKLMGRRDIISILKEFPSATFMLHQWNNEYNYMLFELLWAGYPAIHNATSWSNYGYSYTGADLDKIGALFTEVQEHHSAKLETYKGHARTLAWKHSPYNPEIQKGWADLLG